MRKALAVGKKEFRQIMRDRRTLMILLFIPVFFLLLYGYALNFDIKHVALAVEDRDNSVESRALVSAFLNSGYFDLAGYDPLVGGPRPGDGRQRGAGGAHHPREHRPRSSGAVSRRRCR